MAVGPTDRILVTQDWSLTPILGDGDNCGHSSFQVSCETRRLFFFNEIIVRFALVIRAEIALMLGCHFNDKYNDLYFYLRK